MRLICRVLIVISLVLIPAMSASAQSTPESGSAAPSPFAPGLNEVATYLDQRGLPVLEFVVTGVERGWDGYDSWSEPQAGSDYVIVSVTATNLGTRPFVIEPYDFNLVDSLGVSQSRAWVSGGRTILTDDTTIDGGSTLEFELVFEVFSDLDPLMLMWTPEYDVYVMMYLGE